ncbi:MAG: formylglycine-generating enzyme family protein [Deltaproteobacteria bacterium]|nr:formylglycine-generating enzyme family protein [Deltaproteobacteria bacterium]
MLKRKCPICFADADDSLPRCPRCGWDFPAASGDVLAAARWLAGRMAEARLVWNSGQGPSFPETAPDEPRTFGLTKVGSGPGADKDKGGPGLRGRDGGPDEGAPDPVSGPPGDGGATGGPPPPRVPPRLTLVGSSGGAKGKAPPAAPAGPGRDMVPVPSGLFIMGAFDQDKEAQSYERPRHGVILSRPFRLGRHPVSQCLFESVMGYNPSVFRGPCRPVENVTWHEAGQFVERLGRLEGGVYRLPTEAEWEYAAKAGAMTPWPFGGRPDELQEHAWFNRNSSNQTKDVGLRRPNPWGFFDMLGNVWEWVSDWYEDYSESTATNPVGPPAGASKVIRGGAWGSAASLCRPTTRNVKNPDERSPLIGFRLAMDGLEEREEPDDDPPF